MVALRLERLSKTDTVGVSDHTRGGGLIFSPPNPQPWARALIAKLDFQVNLAPGMRDTLQFQTWLTFAAFPLSLKT